MHVGQYSRWFHAESCPFTVTFRVQEEGILPRFGTCPMLDTFWILTRSAHETHPLPSARTVAVVRLPRLPPGELTELPERAGQPGRTQKAGNTRQDLHGDAGRRRRPRGADKPGQDDAGRDPLARRSRQFQAALG